MSRTATVEQPLIVRLLVERGVIPSERLEDVARARSEHPDCIEEALVVGELASEAALAEAYAGYLHVPWIERAPEDQGGQPVEHLPGDAAPRPLGPLEELAAACRPLANAVTEAVCRKHRLLPLRQSGLELEIACVNPTDFAALEEVRMRSLQVVRPLAVTSALLAELTGAVFGERDVVREIASEGGRAGGTETEGQDEDEEMEFVLDLRRAIPSGKDSQVVRIVNVLLTRAIEEHASDIHIEPYEDLVRVRYRIDGKLVETTPPPRSLFVPTVSRLKILAKMDIAEKRIPQDGAIALKSGEKRVDLRVSTVPTVYGEKMVIRILEKGGIPDKLEQLGFSEKQAQDFLRAAEAPHGLMFVTGPTGSGKSTTLYTCLKLINSPQDNIVTVEDPVEYKFFGLNQVHVRANVGLTFAAALRSFLRQDPDKIMVGEVRDQETAQICMRAALTGHLVLSTLHTNNSLQVINRVVDMGVEPFLLGPALRLVEAQRLLRKLCPDCKQPYTLPEDVALRHGLPPGATLYRRGAGACLTCKGNGTKGRLGMYEVIPINETLRDLIASRAPVAQLEKAARAEGVLFLDDSARKHLLAGLTTLEEVAEYVRVES
ncbi:MAG TPA: GspE/PulE family protein [Planctomycetota bacterium]|nr:GspE/PulE family protein [Planctomycetota bacterium]